MVVQVNEWQRRDVNPELRAPDPGPGTALYLSWGGLGVRTHTVKCPSHPGMYYSVPGFRCGLWWEPPRCAKNSSFSVHGLCFCGSRMHVYHVFVHSFAHSFPATFMCLPCVGRCPRPQFGRVWALHRCPQFHGVKAGPEGGTLSWGSPGVW